MQFQVGIFDRCRWRIVDQCRGDDCAVTLFELVCQSGLLGRAAAAECSFKLIELGCIDRATCFPDALCDFGVEVAEGLRVKNLKCFPGTVVGGDTQAKAMHCTHYRLL